MNPWTLALLGFGLYFLLSKGSGSGSGSRVAGFVNAAGQQITSARCGEAIGFDVPGYDVVWLIQVQNGAQQFNGRLTVPMAPYPLSCPGDVGQYETHVFELNDAGNGPGAPIFNTALTVTA